VAQPKSKIERDLLARGVFTSAVDLARKIRWYMRHYSETAKPVRWSYRNPARIADISEYSPLVLVL
jgi:hypothetical protein